MKLLMKHQKTDKFNIKQNGIQVIEDNKKIEIYNDPFRTVPLFITKDKNQELIIFSNFENFYNFKNIDKTIDEIGFWEIVLFGSSLWTRTLYKSVKQMPSASKIAIDKETNEYTIERYWNFNVNENTDIDSEQKAAKGLYDRLDVIFSKLDIKQKYIMGMSGGMDSRINLAFLSKYIPKENLKLFTYGFDEKILEYKYAKQISKALRYSIPKFHKLNINSYKTTREYLPQISGGQIGINHCHILDYLKNNNLAGYKQLSTYFSDAIFGWDCVNPKNIKKVSNNYYIDIVKNSEYLPETIKEEIKKDSIKIFESFDKEANYSSLNEYKYVTERNQKFHTYLAFLQGQLIDTDILYANYELLKYVLSIPIKFREQKKLIDYILDNYFKNISSRDFKNISSRFQWGSKFSALIDWYGFKFLNRANLILRLLTKGHIQLFNKYQTEEQDRLLYRDFHYELKKATAKFVKSGLMTKKQKKYWDKLPLKSKGISERFYLISLGKLI